MIPRSKQDILDLDGFEVEVFPRTVSCPHRLELGENYAPWWVSVAPTVFRIVIASVPSPYGLGYVLPRLWRSGFVAIDLKSSGGDSRLVIGNSQLVVSGLRVATQRRRGGRH